MTRLRELFRGLRVVGRILSMARSGTWIIRRRRFAERQRLRREAMKHRKTPPVRAGEIFLMRGQNESEKTVGKGPAEAAG